MSEESQKRRGSRRGHRRRMQPIHGPADHMAVGKIVGPHGLTGEVKVEIHTDNQHRFDVGNELLIGSELWLAVIASSRPHRGMQLVRFAEVVDRVGAEELRGEWLYIPDEAAMELDDQTFWVHQIVGLRVLTSEGKELGKVSEVLFTGANDVYVVKTPETINQGRDLLIPALESVVESVDLAEGILQVTLPPGILEDEEVERE